jgi:N-ethylmaleimide reductase
MIHHQQGNQPGDLRPLLRPVTLGGLDLPNRVVMAPATRCRADPATLTVTGLHAAYYAQRASAGLIVAEGTWVSEQAAGRYPDVPGIYRAAQVAAWHQVTNVVHAVGGRIVLQLWHTGAGFGPGPAPGTMTAADLRTVVRDFGTAAGRARQAGFDGVEIAANGTYLLAQSLHPRLNRRPDGYGADRGRLLREVTDAVATAWDGPERTGVRLSPYWTIRDEPRAGSRPGRYPFTADEETLATCDDVVTALSESGLGYLHLRGPAPATRGGPPDTEAVARYRKLFGGSLVANHGYEAGTGDALVGAGLADAVSFAARFIANPDLVSRLALGHELAEADRGTYYRGGDRGYVDYPIWSGR